MRAISTAGESRNVSCRHNETGHITPNRLTLCVAIGDGEGAREAELTGRTAWACRELLKAGEQGCSPITTPGPRWSDYVFKLKRQHGIDVATVTERHGGAFPGNHARYVLRSKVRILSTSDVEGRA
jgi:hypothetical protein